MWNASISRIALSTSLAVAGGLSLVGVLASLPSQQPAPKPVPALSSADTARDTAEPQGGSRPALRQTAEQARAIERVEAILATPPDGPATGGRGPVKHGGPGAPESGAPSPAELANIAPAAGRPFAGAAGPDPAGALPNEQLAWATDGSAAQGTTEGETEQFAERLALDSNPDADEQDVAGAYVASTMRSGGQSEDTGAELPGDRQVDAAAADPVVADQAAPGGAPADRAAEPPPVSAQEAIGFVIIGSFRDQQSAARLVGDHRAWLPQILTKQVGGVAQYRVAVGPFRTADLPAARQSIIASGIADAWLLPLGKAATPLQSLDILG